MNKLSPRSMRKLSKVHPKLVQVVIRATELAEVDIQVSDSNRTLSDQKCLHSTHRSHTLQSKHLIQDQTGYAHAIDLMAFVEGTGCWELEIYDKVVTAMKMAAIERNISILWGGAWTQGDIRNYEKLPADAMNAHIDECRAQGVRPPIDHLHFELVEMFP